MGKSKSKMVPIIPLPKGQILLPGVSLRIAIAYRPDIAALLARVYSITSGSKGDSPIPIGCVPLGSHLLSPDGKHLIEAGPASDADPSVIRDEDTKIFGLGTLAKVTGVQGRVQGELALIVEGISRFRVEQVTQERPYYEARIQHVQEAGR